MSKRVGVEPALKNELAVVEVILKLITGLSSVSRNYVKARLNAEKG